MNMAIAACCWSLSRDSYMAISRFAYGRTLRSTALHVMLRNWLKPSSVAWKVSSSSNMIMLNEVVVVVGRATKCYQV